MLVYLWMLTLGNFCATLVLPTWRTLFLSLGGVMLQMKVHVRNSPVVYILWTLRIKQNISNSSKWKKLSRKFQGNHRLFWNILNIGIKLKLNKNSQCLYFWHKSRESISEYEKQELSYLLSLFFHGVESVLWLKIYLWYFEVTKSSAEKFFKKLVNYETILKIV